MQLDQKLAIKNILLINICIFFKYCYFLQIISYLTCLFCLVSTCFFQKIVIEFIFYNILKY